jgi:very-short-patch-repair endonuclease
MKEVKKIFARQLRKDQTWAEKVVWEQLRDRKYKGLKFRRQHVIEGFVVDFYCSEIRLGIEVDGSVHIKQKDYDRLRQEVVESEGVRIIRITNKELRARKRSIIDRLNEVLG